MEYQPQGIQFQSVRWKCVLPYPGQTFNSPLFVYNDRNCYFKVTCKYKPQNISITGLTSLLGPNSKTSPLFAQPSNTAGLFRKEETHEDSKLNSEVWNFTFCPEYNCRTKNEIPFDPFGQVFPVPTKRPRSELKSTEYILPYCYDSSVGQYKLVASSIGTPCNREDLFMFENCAPHIANMLFVFVESNLIMPMNLPKTSSQDSKWSTSGEHSNQTLCFESLSMDMGQLFDRKEHSDFILKCEDSSFYTHKSVLSTRSDVFAAMFRTIVSETDSGEMTITDMEPIILEKFLRFLYSGTVDLTSTDTATKLWLAAEKYDVRSLQNLCSDFILKNMSKEIVCDILYLANKFGANELLDGAASFAAETKGFLKTAEWKDFATKHSDVAVKVYLISH